MQCACTSTVLIRLPAMTTSQRRCGWAWTPPPELVRPPAEISQSTKAIPAVPPVGESALVDIYISSRRVDLAFGASLIWPDQGSLSLQRECRHAAQSPAHSAQCEPAVDRHASAVHLAHARGVDRRRRQL